MFGPTPDRRLVVLTKLARYIGHHHLGLLALFVALGGTSYATVLNVPRNSVGTLELKRNAVKASKLAPGAVRTGHVLDGSLLTADFKAGQIPQGPKGDRGQKGDRGEKGDPGATNVVVRTQQGVTLPPNSGTYRQVMCEAGERAVGGGGGLVTNTGAFQLAINGELQQSFPLEADLTPPEAGDVPVGWFSFIYNGTTVTVTSAYFAVCARP
jgi:hypothetical protein